MEKAVSPPTRVSLRDKYEARSGNVLLSGVQALVRLMLLQADRDRAAGWNTAGFVSGYRGSPLGTLDTAFAGAADMANDRGIVVRPAVNEEMAATAISGSQQTGLSPGSRVEGVFSLWYGKGPGLDRASDAIRHGNYQGAAARGGVVVAVGDDHLAKSSSAVCCSDQAVVGLQLPLVYPADAGEIVTLGLHAFAMSRLTGAWIALKVLTDVADAARTVPGDELAMTITMPEIEEPASGLHNTWPIMPLDQERRHVEFRLPAIHAYARANGIDRTIAKTARSRIGLVAAGKPWLDLLEGLRLLGIGEGRLEELGIALYKPALIWPLEPQGIRDFARGLTTIVVVEEKGPLIEDQIKATLYGQDRMPVVLGKRDAAGGPLMPAIGDLTPEDIAVALASLLAKEMPDSGLSAAGLAVAAAIETRSGLTAPPALRKPYFCSGCPHNRSTVLPEGSRAMAGIGCHGMAALFRPGTGNVSQMGGEGVHWMGLSPFTDEKHMFANLGDGTYFHSGILAVRQAVAANVNLTYKLLFNDAVAMTGGQSVDGELTVPMLVDQLRAEGVQTIVICTDDPDRHADDTAVRNKVDRIVDRDDFNALQIEMRDTPGVSVIIYEQMCATEKRRLRKRGKLAEPAKRIFINELVCEGCGDCSVKSSCLSVEPVETELGTKRRINQSSCNKDYSCLNGFCPSLVTVEGGQLVKGAAAATDKAPDLASVLETPIPAPALAATVEADHQRILVAGVGGTGIVTIGALLTTSGHMARREVAVLDQVGMAQKGGAVTSHIHIAKQAITAVRIPVEQADLILACDQIVGNSRDVMAAIAPGKTHVVANADVSITGDFTQDGHAVADSSMLARRLGQRAGEGNFLTFPFSRLAEVLLGDTIGSNLMMVGVAYQMGWIDLPIEEFQSAIELNGVAVSFNQAAFAWGRRLAIDPAEVFAAAGMDEVKPQAPGVDTLIDRRAAFLAEYQDQAYAESYRAAIARVRQTEDPLGLGTALTEAAARGLFKVMAYKDEYEVSRLFTEGTFDAALRQQFEGKFKISYHLAPPIGARRDPATGHLRKRRFGPAMKLAFRVLARCKGLRGTPFDPFGWTQERKAERALIPEYRAVLDRLAGSLTAANHAEATRIAGLVMDVRGYGHIKDAALAAYRTQLDEALAGLDEDGADSRAAPQLAIA